MPTDEELQALYNSLPPEVKAKFDAAMKEQAAVLAAASQPVLDKGDTGMSAKDPRTMTGQAPHVPGN